MVFNGRCMHVVYFLYFPIAKDTCDPFDMILIEEQEHFNLINFESDLVW